MGVATRLVAGTEITGNSRVIDSLNPLWLPKPKSFKQVEGRSDYSSIVSVVSYFQISDGWWIRLGHKNIFKMYFQLRVRSCSVVPLFIWLFWFIELWKRKIPKPALLYNFSEFHFMSKDVAVCRHNEGMEERGKIGWVEARRQLVLRISIYHKMYF